MLTSERTPDQALPQRSARNQSMECCKLVASFFVVFIHARFPGDLGGLMDCLGHFAVPLFFMISGYFNYRASGEDVTRRTIHIVKLLLLGTGAFLFWRASRHSCPTEAPAEAVQAEGACPQEAGAVPAEASPAVVP